MPPSHMDKPSAMASVWLMLACTVSLCAATSRLVETQPVFNLTMVDNAAKNSGKDPESYNTDGYVGITATADNKGRHLAEAAPFISQMGGSAAAQTLLSLASTPATKGAGCNQAGCTQFEWSNSIYPYLQYFGGQMLTNDLPIYVIFYGTWTATEKNIVQTFVESLGNTNPLSKEPTVRGWWATTVRYYADNNKKRVSSNVTLGGVFTDPGSLSPKGNMLNPLTAADIKSIVAHAVDPKTKGHLPKNPQGAYAVLTSADLYVVDFCTNFCAYHSSALIGGVQLAYAFVGNPKTQCDILCTYRYQFYQFSGINDFGVDSLVDHLAHELSSIATNPFHSPRQKPGWAVAGSMVEPADLCEFNWGILTTFTPKTMMPYNVVGKRGMKFLLQNMFNRRNYTCVNQGSD